jgi:hypothetical protein
MTLAQKILEPIRGFNGVLPCPIKLNPVTGRENERFPNLKMVFEGIIVLSQIVIPKAELFTHLKHCFFMTYSDHYEIHLFICMHDGCP